MKRDPEHRTDKLALFIIAGMVVAVLGGVVFGVFARKMVPDKGDVLLGGITTGLILFLRDLVRTVQLSWEGQTWGKALDNAAASTPKDSINPQPVEVTNSTENPVPTTEAKGT